MDKIKNISQLKFRNKRVGLVTGVFDILHFEHVDFLEFAKKKADVLIVGLESDENVRILKGKNRPIFDFKERASVLSSFECVDFIFKIPSRKKAKSIPDFYKGIVKEISPDIFFSAIKADGSWKQKKEKMGELGVEFVPYSKKPTVSSSKIISLLLK
ncbi:MAG: adenylyltransferase/cytidyltransferase family protein, partial [Candidatus Pacebacteria bacterium]|nr:adenylyltransferase/cytidyltransferase family protein [Candidatus Paceibacterota bacterium]